MPRLHGLGVQEISTVWERLLAQGFAEDELHASWQIEFSQEAFIRVHGAPALQNVAESLGKLVD